MEGKTKERRSAPRTTITGLVRVRPLDPSIPAEVASTSNASPTGLYFLTSAGHYLPGMQVYVARNFEPGEPHFSEEAGAIVRVDRFETGQCGVAVRVFPTRSGPSD